MIHAILVYLTLTPHISDTFANIWDALSFGGWNLRFYLNYQPIKLLGPHYISLDDTQRTLELQAGWVNKEVWILLMLHPSPVCICLYTEDQRHQEKEMKKKEQLQAGLQKKTHPASIIFCL